jgi:hypothetical protein
LLSSKVVVQVVDAENEIEVVVPASADPEDGLGV